MMIRETAGLSPTCGPEALPRAEPQGSDLEAVASRPPIFLRLFRQFRLRSCIERVYDYDHVEFVCRGVA